MKASPIAWEIPKLALPPLSPRAVSCEGSTPSIPAKVFPSIEVDHLRAHLAMDGIERGLANRRRGRLNSGQWSLNQSSGCRDGETHYPNMGMAGGSTGVRRSARLRRIKPPPKRSLSGAPSGVNWRLRRASPHEVC